MIFSINPIKDGFSGSGIKDDRSLLAVVAGVRSFHKAGEGNKQKKNENKLINRGLIIQ